jgi:hypothetical protein
MKNTISRLLPFMLMADSVGRDFLGYTKSVEYKINKIDSTQLLKNKKSKREKRRLRNNESIYS